MPTSCGRFLVLLLILAMGGGVAGVSAKEIPPPRPPFVQQAPDGSEWTVALTYAQPTQDGKDPQADVAAQETPARMASLRIRKGTNGIGQGDIKDTDGTSHVFYIVGNHALRVVGKGDKVLSSPLADGEADSYASPMRSDFPGLGWLEMRFYTGTEEVDGTTCYRFHTDKMANTPTEVPIEATAWIGVDDHYPVRVRLGQVTYEFSAVKAYRQAVNLPPDIARKVEQMRRQQEAMERIRARNQP